MQIQVRSANGISLIPLETRHMSLRRVFIRGEISLQAAWEFQDKIMLLNDESATDPIDLFITSPGGDIRAGMMMYDVIQNSEAPIRMYCQGIAYSMAAVLFACGRHGRYMLPHSELMLHEPLLGNAVHGNASSIRNISQQLLDARDKINRLLARHTGKSVEEVELACNHDHFFSPEESVEFGLADGILGKSNYEEVKDHV